MKQNLDYQIRLLTSALVSTFSIEQLQDTDFIKSVLVKTGVSADLALELINCAYKSKILRTENHIH